MSGTPLDLVTDFGATPNNWAIDNTPNVIAWLNAGMAQARKLTIPSGFFKCLNSNSWPVLASGTVIEGAGPSRRLVDPLLGPVPPPVTPFSTLYVDGSGLNAQTAQPNFWSRFQISQIPGTSTGIEVAFSVDGVSDTPNTGTVLEDLYAAGSAYGYVMGQNNGADQYHSKFVVADYCGQRGYYHVNGIDCMISAPRMYGRSAALMQLEQIAGLKMYGGEWCGNGTNTAAIQFAYNDHGRGSDGDWHFIGGDMEGCDAAINMFRQPGIAATFGNIIFSGLEFGGITYGVLAGPIPAPQPIWLNEITITGHHASVGSGHCFHLDGCESIAVGPGVCYGDGASTAVATFGAARHAISQQVLVGGIHQGTLG